VSGKPEDKHKPEGKRKSVGKQVRVVETRMAADKHPKERVY
jgi:hypothetical protein